MTARIARGNVQQSRGTRDNAWILNTQASQDSDCAVLQRRKRRLSEERTRLSAMRRRDRRNRGVSIRCIRFDCGNDVID